MKRILAPSARMSTPELLFSCLLIVAALLFGTTESIFAAASAEAIWTFDADHSTKHVETADLNGDNIPDVIVAEYSNNYYGDISWVFGINGPDGDTIWEYQILDGARSMAVGDINNDDIVDVIIGCSYHSTQTPDGRIHAIDGSDGSQLWTCYIGATIQSVAIGDFNGDEYMDVAAGAFDDRVYAVNGLNGAQLWSELLDALWINAVATADVNGDNIDDIAYAHQYLAGWDNYCGVLDGTDGSDIWKDTVLYTVMNVVIVDIDDDGTLETVFGGVHSNDHAEVFVRTALDGTAEWSYDLGQTDGVNDDVLLGVYDVDSDSDPDLVVNGRQSSQHLIYHFDGGEPSYEWVSEPLDGLPRGIAFGDVTGNGILNVVLATGDRVQVLSAESGKKLYYFAVAGSMYDVAVADLSNNDTLDIAAAGGAEFTGSDPGKSVWALKTVPSQVYWEYLFGEYGNALTICDLNGDEYMDVVAVCSIDDKAWALDGKTGDFLWTWTGTQNLFSVTHGDFNNDGQVDIAVGGGDDMVTAIYGNDGSTMWQYTQTGDQIYRKCLRAADLNDDGNVDVIAGADDSHVHAINGETGGQLWATNVGGHVGEIKLAQMNDAGPLDIIVGVAGGGGKAAVLDGADGSSLWSYLAPNAVEHVEVLDANNDGTLDIACAVTPYGTKEIILVDGETETDVWSVPLNIASNTNGMASGDLNDDGYDDVVVPGNSTDRNIYALSGLDGSVLWSYPTGGEVNCLLAYDVNNDNLLEVVAGSDDQIVYVLKGATGEYVWSYSCADDVIHLGVGDISGDSLPNIVCVTFGSDGVVYVFESLASEPLPPTYICGDADGNEIVEISDAVYLINYVFVPGSPAPDPLAAGDVDCNDIVEITDAVSLINYIFVPGSAPPCDPDNDGVPDC